MVPVLFSVVMVPKFRIDQPLDDESVPVLFSVEMDPPILFWIAVSTDEIVRKLLIVMNVPALKMPYSEDEIVPRLLNVVMVLLLMTAMPTAGEIEPLSSTVKPHSKDAFV